MKPDPIPFGTTNSFRLPSSDGVYLLHSTVPLEKVDGTLATHYLGWTGNLRRRFREHKSGNGSPLTRAYKEAKGTLICVRIWPGASINFERRLKHNAASTRCCPLCNPDNWSGRYIHLTPEDCSDGLPFGVNLHHRWPTPFCIEQKFRRFWPLTPYELCQATTTTKSVERVMVQGRLRLSDAPRVLPASAQDRSVPLTSNPRGILSGVM